MAIPKKGLRKITVNGLRYAWSVTGGDYCINLSVIPLKHQTKIITAGFSYHTKIIAERTLADGTHSQQGKQQISITSYIVRQVILHALKTGWRPEDEAAVLNLGMMDDKIDLRLGRENIE